MIYLLLIVALASFAMFVRLRTTVSPASRLLMLALLGVSSWTLLVVRYGASGPLAIDARVHALCAATDAPWLTFTSQLLARVGDTYGVLALLLPWAAWLLWRRRLDAVLHIGGGLALIALLNIWGKALIDRPRPATPDYLTGSMAYPSAHTSTAVVLAGLAAAFIARELPHRQRHWAYWGATLFIVPMALSRLVIGVHWFSDLIGGALLGLVVCALVQLAWQARPRSPLAPCPAWWLGGASLALVAARIAWLPPI